MIQGIFVFPAGIGGSTIAAWTVISFLSQDFRNQVLSLTTVQVLALLVTTWTTAVFNFWAAEQRVEN